MNDKDQAAIDHVASVSKHPHAAMIVKWLITGWDVKTKIGKEVIENPTWFIDIDYELIEPKPVKPAYRVYKHVDSKDTFTIDRYLDGSVSHELPSGCAWLGDWIEYNNWPTPLVERIAAIDIEAAEWIVDNWGDLLAKKYTRGRSTVTNNELISMFAWDVTPQGDEYWREIAKQLGE